MPLIHTQAWAEGLRGSRKLMFTMGQWLPLVLFVCFQDRVSLCSHQHFVPNVFCNFPRQSGLSQAQSGPTTRHSNPSVKMKMVTSAWIHSFLSRHPLPSGRQILPSYASHLLFSALVKLLVTGPPPPPPLPLFLKVSALKATPWRKRLPSHHTCIIALSIMMLFPLEFLASFPLQQKVGNKKYISEGKETCTWLMCMLPSNRMTAHEVKN